MDTVNYLHFTQAECVQYFDDVVSISERQDLEALAIAVFFSRFKQVINEVKAAYRPDNDARLTEVMVNFDDERDLCIGLVRSLSQGNSKHFRTDKAVAGKRILSCIDKYGSNIPRQSYQVESASLDKIYEELTTKQELIDAVTLLNLQEEVTEMDRVNTEFKKARMNRIESQGERGSMSFKEKIDQGIDSCKEYFRKIMSASEFNEELDYSTLIDELNVVIEEVNTTALRRSSLNNKVDESVPPKI